MGNLIPNPVEAWKEQKAAELEHQKAQLEQDKEEAKQQLEFEREKLVAEGEAKRLEMEMSYTLEVGKTVARLKEKYMDSMDKQVLAYYNLLGKIIEGNNSVLRDALPLISAAESIKDEGTAEKMKETAKRALEGYQTPVQLLEYAKAEATRMQIENTAAFNGLVAGLQERRLLTND